MNYKWTFISKKEYVLFRMIKVLFFIIAFVVFVNFIVQTITGLDVTKLQLAEEVISKYRINFALERAENFFLYVGGFAFAWVIINIGENVAKIKFTLINKENLDNE